MNFNISAFTHKGTIREINQDNILVNGQILNHGEICLSEQDNCVCFVADGVGGNNAGEFASDFVLQKLKLITDFTTPKTGQLLQKINDELLTISDSEKKLSGTATTLTGLIVYNNIFRVIHVGDSQLWLLRNDMFFQVTIDQVLDESVKNSPITSYFGGNENNLHLDNQISIYESLPNDIFLICSDGLFKSLSPKIVKSILSAEKDICSKTKKILENCLQKGASDNISVILIHQTI